MRRLVLFDIDGTLLHGGPAKEAFHLALVEVFGTAGPIRSWEFSGKTDPQIARELLTEAGLVPGSIDEGLPRLWPRYVSELGARLPERPTRALPGVEALLTRLGAHPDLAIGLLTGNVVEGARLKLGSAGLDPWFPLGIEGRGAGAAVVGAFGSDHEVRNRLPGIALARARERWGVDFPLDEVVVVGDTPRDVECGRSHGVRTVAVATGRFSPEVLVAAGADRVLADLTDTEGAFDAIAG